MFLTHCLSSAEVDKTLAVQRVVPDAELGCPAHDCACSLPSVHSLIEHLMKDHAISARLSSPAVSPQASLPATVLNAVSFFLVWVLSSPSY